MWQRRLLTLPAALCRSMLLGGAEGIDKGELDVRGGGQAPHRLLPDDAPAKLVGCYPGRVCDNGARPVVGAIGAACATRAATTSTRRALRRAEDARAAIMARARCRSPPLLVAVASDERVGARCSARPPSPPPPRTRRDDGPSVAAAAVLRLRPPPPAPSPTQLLFDVAVGPTYRAPSARTSPAPPLEFELGGQTADLSFAGRLHVDFGATRSACRTSSSRSARLHVPRHDAPAPRLRLHLRRFSYQRASAARSSDPIVWAPTIGVDVDASPSISCAPPRRRALPPRHASATTTSTRRRQRRLDGRRSAAVARLPLLTAA